MDQGIGLSIIRVFYIRRKGGTFMYPHSDPTADRAIGSAEREWKSMAKLAYRYRTDSRTVREIPEPDRVFTGIFNRLLTEPLDSLKKMFENQKKQPRKW